MKRVVTKYEDLTKVYRFTVSVFFDCEEGVAASIAPLQNPDGSYDQRALDEYDDFIIEALEIFEAHDFAIIEDRESPYSKSAYYTLVKKQDVEDHDYKFLLFVRISDHPNNVKTRAQKMQFYNERAQKVKQPADKKHQTWKLKEITVNNKTFSSYAEALDEIDLRLRQYD